MTQNLIDSAISITVHEANRFRKATAYVAYRDEDGRIQKDTVPASRVDELISAIRATGVDVDERQMWRRIEVNIERPAPEFVTPAMTAEDRQWLEAQTHLAASAPRKARGARASAWNRVQMKRGRGR